METKMTQKQSIIAPEQLHSFDLIRLYEWLNNQSIRTPFVITGKAGTGKTEIIKYINFLLDGDCIIAAFTNKAAGVLKKRQLTQACTIHKAFYKVLPFNPPKYKTVMKPDMTDDNKFVIDATTGKPTYHAELEQEFEYTFRPVHSTEIAIIDEASMIPTYIIRDLLKSNGRFIFVGDPNQLQPVEPEMTKILKKQPKLQTPDEKDLVSYFEFFKNTPPDITLTKNYRSNTDITNTAEYILSSAGNIPTVNNNTFSTTDFTHTPETITSPSTLRTLQQILDDGGIVLTFKNITKGLINQEIRALYFQNTSVLNPSDRLIANATKHYVDYDNPEKTISITKGDFLTVTKIYDCDPDANTISIQVINEDEIRIDLIVRGFFVNGKSPITSTEKLIYNNALDVDYAYAITGHKSQGSEWPVVAICDECCIPETKKPWNYTAITRAKNNVHIFKNVN